MILKRNILSILLVVFSFFVANYVGYSNFSSILYEQVPERDALNGTQNALANFNNNKTGILHNATHRLQVGFSTNHQVKHNKKYSAANQLFSLPLPVLTFQTVYFPAEIIKTCKFPIYITYRKLII